ncbi:MAG TPA: 6-phosphogluconolactonase [Verrucomicrobiae bacterium]|nr:6-phosphogluconolactonase [Verrucomicrobiae bacterium]
MRFLREDRAAAEHAIAKAICDGLADNKRVLWLVSGGSNITLEKSIMDMLHDHAEDRLASLAILPTDERYGPSGHTDSNVRQLRDLGFDPGAATFVDVLMHNTSLEQTVSFYSDVAATALANAGIVVGEFGMGADGHVIGIKPDSPAVETDDSTVTGYKWNDFTRLTLMPLALRQVTTGFLVAYGNEKREALEHLQKRDKPFSKLPVTVLYELPEVCVFNDQIESET